MRRIVVNLMVPSSTSLAKATRASNLAELAKGKTAVARCQIVSRCVKLSLRKPKSPSALNLDKRFSGRWDLPNVMTVTFGIDHGFAREKTLFIEVLTDRVWCVDLTILVIGGQPAKPAAPPRMHAVAANTLQRFHVDTTKILKVLMLEPEFCEALFPKTARDVGSLVR
jgi:hypothetical protein